jgi:hypothetical protein
LSSAPHSGIIPRVRDFSACMKYLRLLVLLALMGGCASHEHPSRKWYQGTMDNQDRDFFIDSFLHDQ